MAENTKLTLDVGDPSALGLISYGIALMCLSFIVANIFSKSDMVMSIIIVGTVGIGIASIIDFLRGQTFGGVAFGGWALFFWAFTYVVAQAPIAKGSAWAAGPHLTYLGWYFIFWAVFGLLTFWGSIAAGKWLMLQIALGFTTLMLILVAIAHWMANPEPNHLLMVLGGISGIIAAFCAGWTAFLALLGEVGAKQVAAA